VPVTNAAEPVAPGGGQMSHAGALFDPAAPPLEPVVPADEEPALDLPVADTAAPEPATVALVAAPAPWLVDELPAAGWDVAVVATVCAATGVVPIAKSNTAMDPVTDGRWAEKYLIIGVALI
jgi:hypothetical protein